MDKEMQATKQCKRLERRLANLGDTPEERLHIRYADFRCAETMPVHCGESRHV